MTSDIGTDFVELPPDKTINSKKSKLVINQLLIDRDKKKEELSYLFNPNFLNLLLDEIQLKVVNERDTIRTIFISSCGRLVTNHQIASYNLLVNDESGAGKDYVTDATLEIWHKDVRVKRTRISPTAFTYWKRLTKAEEQDGKKPWSWDGKICYLEDVSDNVFNSDVFKVMCSSGSHATVVKDQVAIDIQILGKPVIIVTSYSVNPNMENARRFAIVSLDGSIPQTKSIMNRQALKAASGISIEPNYDLRTCLTYLDRYPVRIPFATLITKFLPDGLIMRTHFQRFLDIIKASCCLHQYQREMEADGYLLAIRQDYDVAKQVLLKITSNPKMVSLTKNQQKLLKIFNDLGSGLWFSISDLEPKVTFMGDRQMRRDLEKLANWGLLEKDKQERSESKKPVMVYSYQNLLKIKIPTWEELQDDVKCDTDGN